MEQRIYDTLTESPIIAAVKDEEGLQKAIEGDCPLVFVLFGDICSITGIVERLKEAGKTVFVHLDLIQGLTPKEVAVDYMKKNTKTDGIISTKVNVINYAKQVGLCTVFRVFLLDSKAYETLLKQKRLVNMDILEILPGVMPNIIRRLSAKFPNPVIASGLIMDKTDVMEALKAGAAAISTTNQQVWDM